MTTIAASVPKASAWKRFVTWFARVWSQVGHVDEPKTEEEIKFWLIR